MTNQLRLVDPTPSPKRSSWHLDDHTREVGREGLRNARAALAEAKRNVALRDAERRERRDNELIKRSHSARQLYLAHQSGEAALQATTAPGSDQDDNHPHRSAA